MYHQDTIAAIATPPGEGGIAIVRISGPDAEKIAAKIFVHDGNGKALRSHVLYHGKIRDPKSARILDEVLLAVMHKPRSYTGEDVVEVHCHGGVFLVRQILAVVLSEGARHADRGEFTKRAFLNGRLDLSQAEAVLDLIRAKTDKGVDLALSQASGELSLHVADLRQELLESLVQVEASVDFPEEEIELAERQELRARLGALSDKLLIISSTYDWGKLFRDGARVCICGRPNVGKSSLLNALLDEERAIVTPVPGTTRDIIEESMNLDGLPVVLWDTAGVRETNDPVESIGVELSRRHIERADAVIALFDGSAPLTVEDRLLTGLVKQRKSLVVVNKTDLVQQIEIGALKQAVGSPNIHWVSATRRDGLDRLKKALRELVVGSEVESAMAVTNLRHRTALVQSASALKEAVDALDRMQPPELVSINLRKAKENLEEIVGIISNDDVLERIFSEFCIGK